MEQSFATMFKNIRQERNLILLLSLTDPNKVKQSEFTDHEIKIIKSLSLEKLHRQRNLKKYVAVFLVEY